MRIILYTGKGGVGKTSVAAATALRAAEKGYRTIVFSTDIAHSLADSFDLPLGSEPTLLAPNLWGQEVDVLREIEFHWGTIQKWLAAVMAWRGLEEILADEMAVIPGMEELSSLLYINHYADSEQFDVLVVDCAPTGETLRLLGFPDAARWWIEKIFPLERKVAKVIRPLVRPLFQVPVPDEAVFASAEKLFHELDRMHDILTNPEQASVRLVLNPEKMVIKETQRTYTYLNLYGYCTDLIICNRLIPSAADTPYFQTWRDTQAKYLQMAEECFAPIPILTVPLMDREVVGLPMLRRLAEELFGEEDPARIFFPGQAHRIESHPGGYTLIIPLPFVEKEQITLSHYGNELMVDIGKYRRNIHLPHTLAGLSVKRAWAEDEVLKIELSKVGGKPESRLEAEP